MATLAQSFLQDLEDLSDDDADELQGSGSEQGEGEEGEEDDQVRTSANAGMRMTQSNYLGGLSYACATSTLLFALITAKSPNARHGQPSLSWPADG